jgi:O-antigen/teichoic acid export membrane protein
MTSLPTTLGSQVRRGLAWSTLNNLVLRLGSLALGIVLARLLTPQQFGVYAVALTVQTVLMTLADLGMSADLIRAPDPERRASTAATLGLVAGTALASVGIVTASPLAALLGSRSSAPAIAVLSGTLVLAGAGVVPFAALQRSFRQRALFSIAAVDLLVSTAVTVSLVLSGWGVMALAVGRLTAQTVSLLLQFRLSGVRPRFGWDHDQAGSVLTFGVPVAAANLLSWALLSFDNVVVARVAGPVQLGYYVLAFNISTWPMTAIGQVVRSVALPAFSRVAGGPRDRSLADGMALAWALTVPAGTLLAVLATPLVELVYGTRWAPAAAVLVPLAIFGAVRVAFDLMASYLLARGASRAVLWLQALWLVALVPAMVIATRHNGIVGAGWAHPVVAVVVTVPAYLWAVHRASADLGALLRAAWPPLAAAVPTWLVASWTSGLVEGAALSLLVGGISGALVYGMCVQRWVRRRLKHMTSTPSHGEPTEPFHSATEPTIAEPTTEANL